MASTVVISNNVFALLARLIVEFLRQNGVQEEIKIARGCVKNKHCNAARFCTTDSEVLCCLKYVLQNPNTNLRDDMVILETQHLDVKYPAASAKLWELAVLFEFGLNEPKISGRSSW